MQRAEVIFIHHHYDDLSFRYSDSFVVPRARPSATGLGGLRLVDDSQGLLELLVVGPLLKGLDTSTWTVRNARHVAVKLDVRDWVAAAEGVPAAGERVGGQARVVEGAAVHFARRELVDAGVVVLQAHVVLAAGRVRGRRVVPV